MSVIRNYDSQKIHDVGLRDIAATANNRPATHALPAGADAYFALLRKKIDNEVLGVLPDRVILDMIDALILRESGRQIKLFDYSVVIAPLFKALEGSMIFIAEELKLGLDKPWQVGRALNEKQLKKYFEDVLDKLKGIDKNKKLEIKIWLTNCETFLTQYRHNPAHYGNEIIIEYEKIVQKTETIFETINELIKRLLEPKLIN